MEAGELTGFGFGGFRSFQFTQYIHPLDQVTLLAGQNNAGKSNVLRFVRDHLRATPSAPVELDRPLQTLPQDWKIELALGVPPRATKELISRAPGIAENPSTPRGVLLRLLNHPSILHSDGSIWIHLVHAPDKATYYDGKSHWVWLLNGEVINRVAQDFAGQNDFSLLRMARNALTKGQWTGGTVEGDIAAILSMLIPSLKDLPPVRVIEAFREIRPESEGADELGEFNGVGLVQRLEQLERPSLAQQDDVKKFQKINDFVRHVLEDDSAVLRIPHDAETILVERSGALLPLASLGTGVHQVIMLAAAATLLDGHLLCIEEPEVHLHPLLQRRLVKYLAKNTTNKYLIATHSAHLLDYENGRVFHLRYSAEDGTSVEFAGTPHKLARVCSDLGYRPSDLLQANAVLWVEGPSDRIYLRHWLSLVAPDLVEGVDYSIMFYGGALLSHLSPNDPLGGGLAEEEQQEKLDEFISLRRLNRHLVVLVDSDLKGPRKQLNATKQRVKSSFEESDGPGFAWITKCYTIENYVPTDMLKAAVKVVHPRLNWSYGGGQWEPPLEMASKATPNKVAIAEEVCRHWTEDRLDVYDLRRRLQEVVDLVDLANGKEPNRAWRKKRGAQGG